MITRIVLFLKLTQILILDNCGVIKRLYEKYKPLNKVKEKFGPSAAQITPTLFIQY